MASLLDLPNELLRETCSLLSNQDIGSFRSTCKSLEPIGTKVLAERLGLVNSYLPFCPTNEDRVAKLGASRFLPYMQYIQMSDSLAYFSKANLKEMPSNPNDCILNVDMFKNRTSWKAVEKIVALAVPFKSLGLRITGGVIIIRLDAPVVAHSIYITDTKLLDRAYKAHAISSLALHRIAVSMMDFKKVLEKHGAFLHHLELVHTVFVNADWKQVMGLDRLHLDQVWTTDRKVQMTDSYHAVKSHDGYARFVGRGDVQGGLARLLGEDDN